MNISIDSRTGNAMMGRTDVAFSLSFDKAIPSRKEVREGISMAISTPAERIVVVRMDNSFGTHRVSGVAHVYPTPDAALKTEKKHLLVRDALIAKEEKKKEEKKAPAKK